MLVFTKSFTRNVSLGLIKYQVIQDKDNNTLVIRNTTANTYLYIYASGDPQRILYHPNNLDTIREIFSKANVERYIT
jgi:hypothetical protein